MSDPEINDMVSSPMPSWLKVCFAILCVVAVGALVMEVRILGYSYQLGLTNSGGPADCFFGSVRLIGRWMLLLMVQGAILVVLLWRARNVARVWRRLALGIVLLGPLSLIAGGMLGIGGTYDAGFGQWVRTHVDDAAIRNWAITQPPVTSEITVPTETQPACVTTLKPSNVEQHPSQCIVIQWGVLASWGTSRKVAVDPSPAATPPNDDHHPWVMVRPGLWLGVQITN